MLEVLGGIEAERNPGCSEECFTILNNFILFPDCLTQLRNIISGMYRAVCGSCQVAVLPSSFFAGSVFYWALRRQRL